MFDLLDKLDVKEWLALNAQLQSKKSALRKALCEKGILKRGGTNNFDHYSYFSEAQYKELFTELFSANGLELKFDEVSYDTFDGTEKQANGRKPKIEFVLFDVETGFYETSTITGEGMDKGDKAGYKAYTGALKYFLANTFMVATGDDPEVDSIDSKMNKVNRDTRKASSAQIAVLADNYRGDNLAKLLQYNGVERLEDLPMAKATELIRKLNDRKAVAE